jgi:regulator of protease activity HflC (stomatin/prohibitin superfamily)
MALPRPGVSAPKVVGAVVAAVVLLVAGSASFTSISTAPDQVGLTYNAGPLQSKRFDGCVGVSTRQFDGPFDQHFAYPASQRNFAFSGAPGDDSPPITIVSKDGIELTVGGVANFLLNTDCEVLRKFHELIGNRYAAYMEDGETSDGWRRMLGVYLGNPLNTAMDRAAQKYTWRELYNDPATKAAWEGEVLDSLPGLVDRQTDGEEDFFQSFALTIQKPDPPQALKDAVTNEQTQVANARAREAQALADRTAAEAQVAVAAAEARKVQEAIAGYGSADEYNKARAIERGINPYQPSYGSAVVSEPR